MHVIFATFSFVAVLHYAYRTELSPAFAYAGLTYRDPEAANYAIAILAVVIVALSLPKRVSRPSHLVLWIMFVVSAAPSMLLGQYSRILSPDEATIMALWVGGSLILARLSIGILPTGTVPRLSLPKGTYWLLLIALALVINIYLVFLVGINLRLVSLADVYDLRSEYKADASDVPLLGYILGIQYNVVNPLLIIRGLYTRHVLFLCAGLGGQLVIYSATGFKFVLFSTPALIAAAWVFRKQSEPSGASFVMLAALGSAGAVLLDKLIGSLIFRSLFVRRFVIVPGILTSVYVLVFMDRPKTYFADSLFPFLDFPYDISPVNLVGLAYFGDLSTAANASLFGHGYLNAGYVGMVLECLVLALLLRLADVASAGLPTFVACLLFVLPAISLSNTSIFTVILTHGFLGAIILAAIMPRVGWLPSGGRE